MEKEFNLKRRCTGLCKCCGLVGCEKYNNHKNHSPHKLVEERDYKSDPSTNLTEPLKSDNGVGLDSGDTLCSKCGHHTRDHSYNVDFSNNLRCDICDCKDFSKMEKEFKLERWEGEFGTKCSMPTAKSIFEREIAVEITTKPKSKDQFNSAYAQMFDRWERAQKLLGTLEKAFNASYEKYGSDPDIWILKFGPTLLALTREMVSQLEFLRKEQERITVKQQNFVWSPIQINMQIHKNIKEYEKAGYLKILKTMPVSNEEETEDEENSDTQDDTKQKAKQRA